MIIFLVCRGFGYTVAPIQRDPRAPKINVRAYDKVLTQPLLPKASYVFTDIDRLSSADRVAAGRLYERLAAGECRVFNDPARVRTRLPLLRELHRRGINDFNAYSVDEDTKPVRFPVFLRIANDHLGPLTDLISDQATLDRAIDGLMGMGYPRSELIIVEYAAESLRPGIYRKLSVFRVGDRYIPHVGVHDTSWVIKEGRSGAASDDLYDEELQTMRTNPFAEHMKPIFEIAGIDFGRVDFSFVNGCPCVYEINTNPTIAGPAAHPSAKRAESMQIWWESLLSALNDIDDPNSPGTQIDVSADDVATIRASLHLCPSMKRGAMSLSEALSRRGESKEAVESAKAALAQGPDDGITMRRASTVLAENGFLTEAIEVARRAVEGDPKNSELLMHFATLLARDKRRSEALGIVNRAMSERPLDVRCHRTLSLVHELLGDSGSAANAIKTLQRSVSEGKIPGGLRFARKLRSERWRLYKQAIRENLRAVFRAGFGDKVGS